MCFFFCLFFLDNIVPTPCPLHSQSSYGGGGSTFSKLMEMGGIWKFVLESPFFGGFLEMGGLSKNAEVAILYWGFSGDFSWCSIGKKSWCIYLSFVNKHVQQNNCLNKIWDYWHCNNFNNVNSYNSCINYPCK